MFHQTKSSRLTDQILSSTQQKGSSNTKTKNTHTTKKGEKKNKPKTKLNVETKRKKREKKMMQLSENGVYTSSKRA